jgi:hypothetical protein
MFELKVNDQIQQADAENVLVNNVHFGGGFGRRAMDDYPSQHAFFTESFIDELAHEANEDAFQYRRKLLQSCKAIYMTTKWSE